MINIFTHNIYNMFFLPLFIIIMLTQQLFGQQAVVIDAGHGYNPDGSNGDGRTNLEIDTNYDVSLRLAALLPSLYLVVLTRPDNGPGSWISISDRAAIANAYFPFSLLSIHCNASRDPNNPGSGTATFYCEINDNDTFPDRSFAQSVQSEMVYYGDWRDLYSGEDYSYLQMHLGILNQTTTEHASCLNEIGFVDNPSDAAKLADPNEQDYFAYAYFEAITTGILDGLEDFITVSVVNPNNPFNTNQVYINSFSSTFTDTYPYGDYITRWSNYKIKALSTCGEVTVWEGSSDYCLIPLLPTYNWIRDGSSYVKAKVYRTGWDNDNVPHTNYAEIKIGNVPNNFITSGTLSSDTYWCGDLTLTGTITVPSGISLTISPGSNIYFTNSASLIINGTLNASGNSEERTTLTKGGSTNWGGIRFNSGSAGSVTYCNISYATTGIYCNNTSSPIISHNIISNGSSGSYGIYCNYSSPDISYNRITGTTYPLWCLNYSSPQLLHNTMTSNAYYGLRAEVGSDVFLGSTSNNGNNSIFNNTSYEVYAAYGSNILARYNYWGWPFNPNEFCIFDEFSSSIDYSNPLSLDPNSGILKTISLNNTTAKQTFFDSELLGALEYYFAGRITTAADLFKNIFEGNKEMAKRKYALNMLKECSWKMNKKIDFASYLDQYLITKLAANEELFATAIELKNQWLLETRNYDDVIKNLNILISNFNKSDNTLKYALFNLGNIYLDIMKDSINAKKYFNLLEKKYPTDPLVLDYKLLLGEIDQLPEVPKVIYNGNQSPDSDNRLIKDFKLLGNYPNPFNPVTVIKYTLPKESNVEIKIYDMLGRELKSFILNSQSSGIKEITWNGRDSNNQYLPSGIYIYQIKVKSTDDLDLFEKTSKLILIK